MFSGKLTIIFVFAFLFLTKSPIVSQTVIVDTLRIHDVILSEGSKNGKKVYTASELEISKEIYDKLYAEWARNPIRRCRPCYLINLDGKESKLKEGFFYLNLPIGTYKEYHANGNLKTEGKYVNTIPLTSEEFRLGAPCIDKCTVKDSIWKHYNVNGKLIKTEVYKKGKLIKK